MSARALSLTGLVFGFLTVGTQAPSTAFGGARWHCTCTCGRETIVAASNLREGRTRSCGKCGVTKPVRETVAARTPDLTGQTFGDLTAVERAPSGLSGAARWRCMCSCGTERVVFAANLRAGRTLSCGTHKLAKPAAPVKIIIDLYVGKYPPAEYSFAVAHLPLPEGFELGRDTPPLRITPAASRNPKPEYGNLSVALLHMLRILSEEGHIPTRPDHKTTFRQWMKMAGVEARTVMRSKYDHDIRMAYDQITIRNGGNFPAYNPRTY